MAERGSFGGGRGSVVSAAGARRATRATGVSSPSGGRCRSEDRRSWHSWHSYSPLSHPADDHGQSSGRSQSPAFTGLFRMYTAAWFM